MPISPDPPSGRKTSSSPGAAARGEAGILIFCNYCTSAIVAHFSVIAGKHRRTHPRRRRGDRKSTRLNSSHSQISNAVFCLEKRIENYGDDISEFLYRAGFHNATIVNVI